MSIFPRRALPSVAAAPVCLALVVTTPVDTVRLYREIEPPVYRHRHVNRHSMLRLTLGILCAF